MKKTNLSILRNRSLIKLLMIMKLCVIFLLISVFSATANTVYSQSTKLSLHLRNATLHEVFSQIERNSEYIFIYHDAVLNLDKRVTIDVKNVTVDKILCKIFESSNNTYKIFDRQIVIGRRFLAPKNVRETKVFSGLPIEQKKTIKGAVVDQKGQPIAGASILVKGTTIGGVTDANGNFLLNIPSETKVLVVSFVGMRTQLVALNGQQRLEITMEDNQKELNEIVVTALGIKREKKALGYAMQEVKTDGFAENRSENVANMLQGKVAGVQIAQSSSGAGGSTRVIMRGLNSLNGDNQPLWVVDGIPIDDSYNGTVDQWKGSDMAGAASEINPDDIESISVLKGPNAAALYGSRAQNGAIVITTKHAKKNQPFSVSYNMNYNRSVVYEGYRFQDTYGQGNQGTFDITSKQSWGPVMTGQSIPNWCSYYYGEDAASYPMTAQKNRIKDFFRDGNNLSNSIAIQGGGENISSRFAFTNSENQGVVPNNSISRKYFDGNINMNYGRLSVDAKMTYTQQETKNRVIMGEYGLMQMFTKMPANIRLEDLQHNLTINDLPMNWTGPTNEYKNPYNYITDKASTVEKRDRLTGVISANFKLTDWLKVSGKTGMDYWLDHDAETELKMTTGSNPANYGRTEKWVKEVNSDLMLNINKAFGDFAVVSNLGGALMKRSTNSLTGNSGTLVVDGFNNLSNGSSPSNVEYTSNKEIQSVLGNAQLGYKEYLFLDLTGRNDWSSTLPVDNRSYFYPSVSLSGVISEMARLPEWINFMKVRGSWAQVGNDTDPYRLLQTYGFETINGSIVAAGISTTKPFSELKPEKTKSWEFGLETKMFEDRVGLDVTYYNSSTFNQILSLSIPVSSGYSSKYMNAGKIKSNGVEVMLSTSPVKTRDWKWNVNLNWGINNTKCVRLDPALKRYTLGGMRIGSVVVDEGGKFGDIISNGFSRDSKGNILVDDNGLPIPTSSQIKVGNMMPKWTGSISNQLQYKNIVMSFLIDIRYGGDILSVTDALATEAGTSKRTLLGRDGMVVNGIVNSTGAVNTKKITAEQYWETVGGPTGIGEAFIYSATYVKLRELSLGYELPSTLLSKTSFVKRARFSLVGRDLFYLLKHTPGTSPEGASSREDWSQAFELNSLPPTRNFGVDISLTF